MNIINLAQANESPIKYKISNFPDGQQNIDFINFIPSIDNSYIIKSPLRNWLDLELIIATKAILDAIVFSPKVTLYVPYLLGARSDRKFNKLGNSYLVQVLAPVLNQANFSKVVTLDVHSDVAAACIKNLESLDANSYIKDFISHIDRLSSDELITLISPDAGAYKKIYKTAKEIGFTGDIITCSKYRDEKGELTKINVPINKYKNSRYLIIDDICDGGRTFINMSENLQENGVHTGDIFLFVTHGIMSAGYEVLQKNFCQVGFTNSYQFSNNITKEKDFVNNHFIIYDAWNKL